MAHICLHPDDIPSGTATVTGPLSSNELRLKKVVDLSLLRPGDLILTSALSPDLVQRSIRAVQVKGGYQVQDARWEHAAMYIGRGVLCEATRRGVQRGMLSHYIGTHVIRARRDDKLNTETRYELAIQALSFQGYAYGFWEILRLFKAARLGFNNRATSNGRTPGYPKRAVICSELYADSYSQVTKNIIGNIAGGEVTPASLSTDVRLTDVHLRWLGVP